MIFPVSVPWVWWCTRSGLVEGSATNIFGVRDFKSFRFHPRFQDFTQDFKIFTKILGGMPRCMTLTAMARKPTPSSPDATATQAIPTPPTPDARNLSPPPHAHTIQREKYKQYLYNPSMSLPTPPPPCYSGELKTNIKWSNAQLSPGGGGGGGVGSDIDRCMNRKKNLARAKITLTRYCRINHTFRNTFPMCGNWIIPLSLGDQG